MGPDVHRARSHAHGHRRGRLTVHLLTVILAVGAVGFAAWYPRDSGAKVPSVVPQLALSGLAGGTGVPRSATYFRPGTSVQTRESIAAITAPVDVVSVRATGAISPVSSFSSGVAAGAAASGEIGAGVKPLADILDPRVPFVLYETQPGDSISGIAQKYGIAVRTLLDNNPTLGGKSGNLNLIQRGQQVIIPRRDGILYKIGSGESVDSIVAQYDNITSATVLEYRPNAIADAKVLKQGEFILLPGATVKPPPPPPPPPPPRVSPPSAGSTAGSGGISGSGGAPAAGGTGRFRFPLATWHGVSDPFGSDRGGGTYHTGIDLDLYGLYHSNIFSACDGVVTKTEYLTYSYGYHVIVDCGDGWTTLYAHMSQINVNPGQKVSAGTILGVSGVTGFTTGEHLHFEIRFNNAPVNPAAYLGF